MDVLWKAAQADNHTVLFPTHVVEKDGTVAGYASICNTPILHVWLDSRRISPRDSLMLWKRGEQIVKTKGYGSVILPCANTSPFYPLMERQGYSPIIDTTLFGKVFHGQ
jgi:hypothetical protein